MRCWRWALHIGSHCLFVQFSLTKKKKKKKKWEKERAEMASRCELLTIHEAQGAPSDCEHQMHPRCAIELIPDSE